MPFIEMSSDLEKYNQPGINILGAIIMIIVAPFLPWPTIGMIVWLIGVIAIPGTIIMVIYYYRQGYNIFGNKEMNELTSIGWEKYRFPHGSDKRFQFTILPDKLPTLVSQIIANLDRNILSEKITTHLETEHKIVFNEKMEVELAHEDKTEHLFFSLHPFPKISFIYKSEIMVEIVKLSVLLIKESFPKLPSEMTP
ncbi:MAG: hypothetical protein ACXAD7_20025 [Candidatus Kariarchaeaceae archaeon]|jgi:hypothetical protein